MKNERKTEVSVEVTTYNYSKTGELIDAIAAGSKLTKADAGRASATDEDALTLRVNVSEQTKAEVDYNGTSISAGDDASVTKTIEVSVKKQVTDAKGEVTETQVAGSKLTKADAGKMSNEVTEDWFNLQVSDSTEGGEPKVIARTNSKVTKSENV